MTTTPPPTSSKWPGVTDAQATNSSAVICPVGGSFSRSGTLKQGSGRHFLVTQMASGPALDLQVLKGDSGAQLDATLQARYGIVRIH